jgi:hypothetical protein
MANGAARHGVRISPLCNVEQRSLYTGLSVSENILRIHCLVKYICTIYEYIYHWNTLDRSLC